MTLPARTQHANEDLLPVSPDRRTWSWWHIASLWIGMAICIPTYTLASGLVDQGWTWQAAVGAVVLGNVVVLLPIALNPHAATRYAIPFPVLARSSFAGLGANIPRSCGASSRAAGSGSRRGSAGGRSTSSSR